MRTSLNGGLNGGLFKEKSGEVRTSLNGALNGGLSKEKSGEVQVRTSLNGGLNGGLFKEKSGEVLSPTVDSGAHPLVRRKSFGGKEKEEPKSATKWR